MSTRLIIDGNAVYEIDEACEAGKQRLLEKRADNGKQETGRKQEAGRILRERQDKTNKKQRLP